MPGTAEAVDEVTGWALAAADRRPARGRRVHPGHPGRGLAVRGRPGRPGAADDLTQETYLRAFRALPAFEGRSSARTWLLGIARRTCADHIRAAVRRRRLLTRVALVQPRPEAEPLDRSATLAADELLARLGTGQRERVRPDPGAGAVLRRGGRDRSDVPIGTIRSRVARARSELLAEVQRTLAV